MKFRFDFLVLALFIGSLVALAFSRHETVFVTALIISLSSLALWLAEDWAHILFVRIFRLRFAGSTHQFAATRPEPRTKSGQNFLLKRTCHPLRAHQRWQKTRTGARKRYVLRHRGAF